MEAGTEESAKDPRIWKERGHPPAQRAQGEGKQILHNIQISYKFI